MIMAKVHATFEAVEAPARREFVPAHTDASTGATESPILLSIHHALGAVEQEWRAFEVSAHCTAFQAFDWLAAWQRHIGTRGGVTPAIVIGRSGARVLFLMPLAVEPGLVRRLTWLGSELCDYNAPLLAPDFARLVDRDRFPALWRDIVAALQARVGFDLIDFSKMPETIGGAPNPLLALGTALNPSGAHLTRLHGTWDEFYTGKRSSATRRRDRTKRKRLSDLGEVRFVNPEQRDDVALTLDTLIAQKTRAFARMGVANIFARAGQREFYLDVATNAHGLVHMSRLEVGSAIAATNLGLAFRGCYYYLLASYDDGPTSRFGPGMALLHDLMRRAIELEFDAFDFTIGDESYKLDWSDTELKLHDHVSAASLRGAPVVMLERARRGIKRWIKQTPLLWRTVTRMRALAGSWRRKAPADEPVQMDDSPPTSPR
jgi:CelD/BcsL family acetyltransferase involved in cellulose biosynthesis